MKVMALKFYRSILQIIIFTCRLGSRFNMEQKSFNKY